MLDDVFLWKLDTIIIGQSYTYDLNISGVKGHQEAIWVIDLLVKDLGPEKMGFIWMQREQALIMCRSGEHHSQEVLLGNEKET